jgi:spore protease
MFNTDMADERVDEYKKVHNLTDVDGIKVEKKDYEDFSVVKVDVLNDNGAKSIDKEIGTYVTYEINDVNYVDNIDKICESLTNELNSFVNEKESVMVVGLGNIYITPDALGSRVIKNIEVTRHIMKLSKELDLENIREVSAFCPGVMGNTGIGSTEIVEAVSKIVNPNVIIVIDSLITNSIHRVGNSIQLSNTGISPGSGITNANRKISKDSTGAQIISIGVPMVLDISGILDEKIDNYIVTPKDVDDTLFTMSEIISKSINNAM